MPKGRTNKIIKLDEDNYSRAVFYLPQYKDIVDSYWAEQPVEIDNNECGFLLIRQGVFTQRKGWLLPYVGQYVFEDRKSVV